MESPVYSLQILLGVGIALGLAGLLLGWLAGKRSSADARKQRELTLKLDQVVQDKQAYEDDVVEHFTETAKLLNNLTESYREVHNHLAQGATGLCQGKGPVSLDLIRNGRDPSEIPGNLTHLQPPLDYAPKASPDEKGMLNEEFGLERESDGPRSDGPRSDGPRTVGPRTVGAGAAGAGAAGQAEKEKAG